MVSPQSPSHLSGEAWEVGLPGPLGHDINGESLFLASAAGRHPDPRVVLPGRSRRDGGMSPRARAPEQVRVPAARRRHSVGLATLGPSASLGVPGGAGTVEAQSPS